MGDRSDRARAWRMASIAGLLAALALVSTVALAIAIPTQGENPRAWGVIVCGLVTVEVCGQVAVRNWRLLRHYRGDDLAPRRQARAKAAR
ncbi:hypothetical protein [Leifsonia sp. fls2-241-R2A-40a]|uniref:hypothetical protein n=1 Tax=Leifsonia sp. fls2-241-R2A-40a TaxID=3040290 RepID=UPI00254B67EC|nr:hypothetical protein [Leifsonia sp. fls2-241-R2A-40a]